MQRTQHSCTRLRVQLSRTAQHSTACTLLLSVISLRTRTQSHSTSQHITAHHITSHHSTAQHSTAQYSTAQYSTAQHSTAQHSTAQHSTAQPAPSCCAIVIHLPRAQSRAQHVALHYVVVGCSCWPRAHICTQHVQHAACRWYLCRVHTVCAAQQSPPSLCCCSFVSCKQPGTHSTGQPTPFCWLLCYTYTANEQHTFSNACDLLMFACAQQPLNRAHHSTLLFPGHRPPRNGRIFQPQPANDASSHRK